MVRGGVARRVGARAGPGAGVRPRGRERAGGGGRHGLRIDPLGQQPGHHLQAVRPRIACRAAKANARAKRRRRRKRSSHARTRPRPHPHANMTRRTHRGGTAVGPSPPPPPPNERRRAPPTGPQRRPCRGRRRPACWRGACCRPHLLVGLPADERRRQGRDEPGGPRGLPHHPYRE